MEQHVIAVDVGTGSARAGIVDRDGRLLARAEQAITLARPQDDRGEHSADEIWAACCAAVRAAIEGAAIDPGGIVAIGFDATCSLVLRDARGAALPLREEDGLAFDTIAWLDHRAVVEAADCSRVDHPVLAHQGGALSPEGQIPKLLWLKRHRPDLWARLGHAFDLADYLTWRASGSTARSLSTLTSKWTFFGHRTPGWQADFLATVGLADLRARCGLPESAQPVGRPVGRLSTDTARALGLIGKRDGGPIRPVTVASGMVDAYAGALGVLGAMDAPDGPGLPDAGTASGDRSGPARRRLALIAGTSSCLLALSPRPCPGPSIWGPYYGAIHPDLWLIEAGQSATGALLDHLLRSHAAAGAATPDIHARVIARIEALRQREGPDLASGLNLLTDFHGNRSPFADPGLTGAISGLTLDASFDGLCRLYWRACVGLSLGLRQILETMIPGLTEDGRTAPADRVELAVTGGHVKNALLMEAYAQATGCDLIIAADTDAVLVGTAINAAAAGGLYPDLATAGRAMVAEGRRIRPDPGLAAFYERDYRRLLAMQRHRAELNALC